MKKLGIFAIFSMLCSVCFGAASIRASSVPLKATTPANAPKTVVSTAFAKTSTDSESTQQASATPTGVMTNDARLAFASPFTTHSSRYYLPTSNNNNNNSSNTANTAKEIAELQKQIDDLAAQQSRLRDSLSATVRAELQNSDLNDALSDLQDRTAALDETVEGKLVERGLVDNRGNLLVATTTEIQPITLANKMESTLATKFARKSDITPSRIASEIVTDNAAMQTLSNGVGTNENAIKSVISSDLKQRGITDSTGNLLVAKKSELPTITETTITNALQNSDTLDNMVSQNLMDKGIIDGNKQLQVVKKSDITSGFLTDKLGNTYAKPSDLTSINNKINTIQEGDENTYGSIDYKIKNSGFARTSDLTPEFLENKLNNTYVRPSDITKEKLISKLDNSFITPNQLASKNFATKSDLPVINEETVSAALADSQTLNNTIKKNLQNNGILDSYGQLTLASKSAVSPDVMAINIANNPTARAALTGKIGPDETAVNQMIATDLQQRGITDTNGGLLVAKKSELPVVNESTVSAALRNSGTFNNMVSDVVASKGYVTETALNSKDYVTNSALNSKNYLTPDSATIQNLATKNDISPDVLAIKIANNDTATAALSGKIGTNETKVNELISAAFNADTTFIKRNELPAADIANALIADATAKAKLTSEIGSNVQVSEEAINNAVNNALADSDKITEAIDTALSNNTTFALKSEIAPETLGNALKDTSALNDKFALKSEVGTNETRVNELIDNQLKDSNGDLRFALKSDVGNIEVDDAMIENAVNNALANSTQINEAIDTALSNNTTFALKSEIAPETLGNALKDTSALNDKFALKSEVGTNETRVNELIDNQLKDSNGDLRFALKSDVGNIEVDDAMIENAVNNALASSTQINEAIDTALSNNTTFALKSEIAPETLGNALKDTSALNDKFALKSEVGTNETRVNELIDNRDFATKTALTNAVGTVTTSLNTLNSYVNGNSDTNGSLLYKIKNDEDIRAALKGADGATGPQGPAGQDADASQVATILMADPGFKASVKGEPGTGITYRGEVNQHSELPTSNVTRGDAYYNYADGLLYIYSCDNNNTCRFPDSGNGVPFKGQPGETGQSAWYAYCITGNNLNDIIVPLYGDAVKTNGVGDCTKFTAAQYAAIMGGPRAYCLSLLTSVRAGTMTATSPMAVKLDTVFGAGTFTNVKNNLFNARVQLNGTNTPFMDACEAKYNDIMAGANGTNGEPGADGEDAETIWHAYCMETSDIYPDQSNLDAIIKPLYGNDKTCENFTAKEYHAILGGASAYCLSLATGLSRGSLDLTTGVGARLSNELGTSAVEAMRNKPLDTILNNSAYVGGDKFIPSCEAKYNKIMAGENGQNGQSAKDIYCNATSDIDPNKTNLLAIIQPLYGSSKTCENFTEQEYNAILGGARAYCLSLITTLRASDLTSGIGLKMTKLFGTAKMQSVVDASTMTAKLAVTGFNGVPANLNIVSACEQKYMDVMAGVDGTPGEDAETIWHAYCNDNNQANLTNIIQPLYTASTVPDCDAFTAAQYNAILGGARAYCLSLAQNLQSLDFTTGFGARLANKMQATSGGKSLQVLKASNASMPTILNSTFNGGLKFIPACEAKYNEIMAGEDGADADNDVITRNVVATLKTDSTFKAELKGADGKSFTYKGMVENYTDLAGLTNVSEGDAYYVNETGKLYIYTCNNGNCAFPPIDQGVNFKGEPGENGRDGETVWHAYCEASSDIDSTRKNLFAIIQPLYTASVVPDCNAFTAKQYHAILGGPSAYCLSLATSLSKGMSLTTGIGARLSNELGAEQIAAVNGNEDLASVLNATYAPNKPFIRSCEEKYNEIMGGTNGKSAAQLYCEADAENYPTGTTNLTIIQKLFPNDGINSCADFTDTQYARILGGASAYCSTLTATFNNVTLDSGLGLKLKKMFAKKYNRTESQVETQLSSLKQDSADNRLSVNLFGTTSNPITLYKACVDNFNDIMAGIDGEDGDDGAPGASAAEIWCEKHTTGFSNAVRVSPAQMMSTVQELPTVQFSSTNLFRTIEECLAAVAANPSLMGGESASDQAYNKDRTNKTFTELKTENQYLTLKANFVASLKGETGDTGPQGPQGIQGIQGIPGTSAETAWHAYCSENDNYNLNKIIKKLYPTVNNCDDFTANQYSTIMGGASAYCLSLNTSFGTLTFNSGVGLRIKNLYMNVNGATANAADTALANLQQNVSADDRLDSNNTSAKIFNGKTLYQSCVDNFNSIINGADGQAGQDGESVKMEDVIDTLTGNDEFLGNVASVVPTAWYEYCQEGNNLTDIIQPTFDTTTNSNQMGCNNFTSSQYNELVGAPMSYCLSLAQNLSTLNLSSGVGARLNNNMTPYNNGPTLESLKNASLRNILLAKFNDNNRFLKACAEKYTDIVSGTNGQNGQNGTSVKVDDVKDVLAADLMGNDEFIGNVAEVIPAGKSAAETWCESRIIGADVTRVLTPAQMMSTVSVFSTAEIDSTRNLFVSLQACLDAVAANPGLMSGESAADQDFNKKNEGKNFNQLTATAYTTHLNGFVASLKGADGRNGNDGASAAEIWCRAHTQENGGFDVERVQLNPAQIMRVITDDNAKIDISSFDSNMFTNMQACMAAVAANPNLMSGESVADQEFNAKVEKEGLSVNEIDPGEFTSHQAGFIDNMKVELKGADGKTFVPSINAANGTLSWSAVTGDPTNPASFNLNENAVNAVKADLNVASGTSLSDALNTNAVAAVKNSIDASASNLQAAIDARATAKANTQINSLSDRLLTAKDLINLINSGALTIANNQVSLSSVSLNSGDENAASVASSLRKMEVTYTCSGTGAQQCPTGGAPALISNNP